MLLSLVFNYTLSRISRLPQKFFVLLPQVFVTLSQVFLNYAKNLLQHFSRIFLLCYRHLFLETRSRLKRTDLTFSMWHEQAKALDQNQGHHHLMGFPDQIPGYPQSFTPLLSPPIPNLS